MTKNSKAVRGKRVVARTVPKYNRAADALIHAFCYFQQGSFQYALEVVSKTFEGRMGNIDELILALDQHNTDALKHRVKADEDSAENPRDGALPGFQDDEGGGRFPMIDEDHNNDTEDHGGQGFEDLTTKKSTAETIDGPDGTEGGDLPKEPDEDDVITIDQEVEHFKDSQSQNLASRRSLKKAINKIAASVERRLGINAGDELEDQMGDHLEPDGDEDPMGLEPDEEGFAGPAEEALPGMGDDLGLGDDTMLEDFDHGNEDMLDMPLEPQDAVDEEMPPMEGPGDMDLDNDGIDDDEEVPVQSKLGSKLKVKSAARKMDVKAVQANILSISGSQQSREKARRLK